MKKIGLKDYSDDEREEEEEENRMQKNSHFSKYIETKIYLYKNNTGALCPYYPFL